MIPTAKPPMIRPAISMPTLTAAAWIIPAINAKIEANCIVLLRPEPFKLALKVPWFCAEED